MMSVRTHIETFTVTRAMSGRAVVTLEDSVSTFDGATITEALLKAGQFLDYVEQHEKDPSKDEKAPR